MWVKTKRKQGAQKGQNFTIGKIALVHTHPGMCIFGVQNDVLFGIQKMFLTFSEVRSGKGGWVEFNGQRTPKRSNMNNNQYKQQKKTKRQNKMTKTRTNSSNLNKQQHKEHQTAATQMRKKTATAQKKQKQQKHQQTAWWATGDKPNKNQKWWEPQGC